MANQEMSTPLQKIIGLSVPQGLKDGSVYVPFFNHFSILDYIV